MLNFLHQHDIAAPRISCINSVAAIIKLVAAAQFNANNRKAVTA